LVIFSGTKMTNDNDCELCICICICICICFSEEKKMCKMNDECCIWSCL